MKKTSINLNIQINYKNQNWKVSWKRSFQFFEEFKYKYQLFKMSRYKETKPTLSNLLFSQHGDDSRGLSPQHSYNQMQEGDEQLQFHNPHQDKEWQSNDNIDFLKMNGPCVQFSQNFSQNSMMYSHRQDDDSRDYKNDSNNYMRLLEVKKKEEIQFNQALQQQLNEIKKQLDRMQLENSKLQTVNKGLQIRIEDKQKNIRLLQQEISNFQAQMQKLKIQNQNYLKTQIHRSNCLQEYKKESEKIIFQLAEKQKENNRLKTDIAYLQSEVEKLNNTLSIYTQPDRKLHDFRNPYSSQQYEVPMNLKKNPTLDKQVQKLRKEKNSLQIQFSALKDKLQDREARSKQIEEQNKKKIQLKQKRINQLQQRINEFKDQQMKLKTQNQVANEKLTNNINLKNKEIAALNQKVIENQKRIKSLFEESKKKDEKIKQISLELLEKNRYIVQNEKNIQQMKVKLDFDHQMIEDKDKQIEKLLDQKKILKIQLDNNQKIQKSDKLDKNQREKAKRQVEKLRKQLETARKEIENNKKQVQDLTKENQNLQNAVKQNKKKFEEVSKKMQQLRSSNAQLEEETRKREEESAKQQEAYDKAMRQLNDYKKKNQSVAQLRNKIILLQSRLKAKSDRQTGQSFESTALQDRIDLLQHKLQQKDRQIRALKAKIKNQAQNSDYQLKELEEEIAQRENQIENLLKQNEQLKKELAFKEQTLDFTHKILVNSQKAKIQLEQEKKMLEEMIHGQREDSFDGAKEELTKFYEEKVEQLELMLKKKEDQHRFDVKQLKQRVRELNDMLLSKERRITPETMSPEDTVNFLIKTIKKVNKSADMLRVLSKNVQFREGLARMDRQFRK